MKRLPIAQSEAIELVDDPEPASVGGPVWVVICADDDPSAHRSTRFALEGEVIEGRPVQIISAYSAQEALSAIQSYPEAAAMLLDVVMETPSAGLEAIAKIRAELGFKALRIIVRSGAPGMLSELEAAKRYDISDWRPKSDLTQARLLASMTLAIRSYKEIEKLERRHEELAIALDFLERVSVDPASDSLIGDLLGAMSSRAGPVLLVEKKPGWARLIAPTGCCLDPSLRLWQSGGEKERSKSAALGADQDLRQAGFESFDSGVIDIGERRMEAFLWAPIEQLALFESGEGRALRRALRAALTGRERVDASREASLRDAQTGAWSRAGFLEQASAARGGDPREWAVYLVDLANFARINSALGHQAGDEILRQAARRLEAFAGPFPVGRIASDAFAVMMPISQYSASAMEAAFLDPLPCGDFPVTMSARVSACRASSEEPGEKWLTGAAAALYEAKLSGGVGGEPNWFDQRLEQGAMERMSLSQKLFAALKTGHGLSMVYQPQVDFKTGSTLGVEALIRWRDLDGTMIPPDVFIPIAEQSGLAKAVSNFALGESLQMMARAKAAGLHVPKVSVNISAVEFESQGDLMARVERELERSGVSAEQLEIELTETAAATDPDRMMSVLESLRVRGISVAIDDFGSGYSSLAQLARLPIDKLKIDRAFVLALGEPGPWSGIAKMIIALGQSLGMSVIAEGVEEVDQAWELCQLGCDGAQGWLFAKGMPTEDLLAWLSSKTGESIHARTFQAQHASRSPDQG